MERSCRRCFVSIQDYDRRCVLCWDCSTANALDPVKLSAQQSVRRARRQGLLADPRSMKCADCGVPAREYDHREYAKPLQVDAVCHSCNLRRGPAIDSKALHTSRIKPRTSKTNQTGA